MSAIKSDMKSILQSLHLTVTKAMETGCLISVSGKEVYSNNKPTITEITFQIDKDMFEKINSEDSKNV